MNLSYAIRTLHEHQIEVSLDLGVHAQCDIDSNCPLAIQVRKIIKESGIPVLTLLDTYARLSKPAIPEPLKLDLPDISGEITLTMGGNPLKFDITKAINAQISKVGMLKLEELRAIEFSLVNMGKQLNFDYARLVEEAKKARSLQQLSFPEDELLRYRVIINTDNKNYLFMFPLYYSPQWIVHGGIRYETNPLDVKGLSREVYVVFPIDLNKNLMRAYILTSAGKKFSHYHGADGDCWGHLSGKFPARWDGKLSSLGNMVSYMEKALATVNGDSLMNSDPSGMPRYKDLIGRAKKLGLEGEIRAVDKDKPVVGTEPARTTGWGRRV